MRTNPSLLSLLAAAVATVAVPAQLPVGIYAAGDLSDNVLQYDCNGKFVRELDNQPNVSGCGSLGIEFGPQGNLYVVRCHQDRVLKWNDTTGQFETFIQASPRQQMHNLDFSPDGRHLWVASGRTRTIRQYDARTGNLVTQFGKGPLQYPTDVAVDTTGKVYIADRTANMVFAWNGSTMQILVREGGASVEIGPDGLLYVSGSNSTGSGIMRYRLDGTPFGRGGNTTDPFLVAVAASDMEFGPGGSLFCADNVNDVIREVDPRTARVLGVITPKVPQVSGLWGLAIKSGQPVQGSFTSYSASCPGSPGTRAAHLGTGNPRIGGFMSWELQNAQPSQPGVLLVGIRQQNLDLGIIGMPGCKLALDPAAFIPAASSASGDLRLPIRLDCEPTWVNLTIYSQLGLLDPGAPHPLKIITTNGLATKIGSW